LKVRRPDFAEWILIGFFLIILAITATVNYHVARHVLDDDASSELMLSELLNQEKTLYSEDWYYSTEFNIHNQLVFGPLFNIFDGWANIRFFGTCILQGFYLLSFLYMMSQSGMNWKAILLGCCLIMLPFCISYGRTILYHCYYIPHFGFGFLLIGLLFSFIGRPEASSVSKGIRIFLLVLIAFGNTLLYVRQLFITVIPVTGCLFFYLLRSSDGNQTPWKKWMLIPVLMLVAGAAGTLANSRILIPALDLYQQTEQKLSVLSSASWAPILSAFVNQFGFRSQTKMFSLGGVLSLAGLFSGCVILYESIHGISEKNDGDFRVYLFNTMLPVNLALELVIFVFGEIPFRLIQDYSRYLLAGSVWIVPFLCCQFRKKYPLFHIQRLLFTVCTVIFILNSIYNIRSFLDSEDFGQFYDGISYDNPHMADDLETAVEYIRTHDYKLGYGFAGEANTLSELMNGLPIIPLRRVGKGLVYANWLCRKSYKTLPADRAFFLMTSEDEQIYTADPAFDFAERIYFDDEGYIIYEITDPARFSRFIQEPDQ